MSFQVREITCQQSKTVVHVQYIGGDIVLRLVKVVDLYKGVRGNTVCEIRFCEESTNTTRRYVPLATIPRFGKYLPFQCTERALVRRTVDPDPVLDPVAKSQNERRLCVVNKIS